MSKAKLFFENQFTEYEEMICTLGDEVVFEKGMTISAFDDVIYIYYVLDGIFMLTLQHEAGERKAFCFHGKGSINPYSPARPIKGEHKIELDFFIITAITQVKAIRIKPEVFFQAMLDHSHLATAMLGYVIDHSNLYLTALVLHKTGNYCYLFIVN